MKRKTIAGLLAAAMVVSLAEGSSSMARSQMLDNGRYEKLVVAISEDPQDLEGDDINVGSRYYWIYGIYESLFDFADDSSGELMPCLAKSYEVQDDGTTWLVTLNDDIYDWDGNNITSSDIKFCFDWIVTNGQAIRFDYFKDIEPIDDYTFYIHWNSAPPAISEVEFPLARTLIYSEKAYNDHGGMTTDPCGTGCYKVTDFTAGSKVVMEANDEYWGLDHEELSGRHKATVQTLELDVVTEASTAVIGLETGTIDVCNYVPLSMLSEFETGAQSENYNVEVITQGDYWYMAPNGQTTDENLRKAMYYSLDNGTLATAMGGTCNPATSIGTEGFSDWDDSLNLDGTYITDYDPEKAKEYLAESDYDGRTLTILCVNNEQAVAAATMMQLMFEQVGIKSEINAVTNDTYNTVTSPAYSDEWDLMLNTIGGPNMVGSWHLLFDNEVNNGLTFSLIEDDQLQELYEAAVADATHDAEHMRAVLDYVVDKGYVYSMCKMSAGLVYTKDIAKMFYREGYFTPGAASFVTD